MTAKLLDWYALTREAVPGVLLGVEPTSGSAEQAVRTPSNQFSDLMVGIECGASPNGLATPYIALVADSNIGELFAWLHTFSNESFPISQFCRIESSANWNSLLKLQASNVDFRGTIWASIIAGEMLANAEQSIEPKAMPLSWSSSCFSYTMAKTYRLVGQQVEIAKDSVNRLNLIESDSRFSRRKVSVNMLSPIWNICESSLQMNMGSIRDVIESTLATFDNEGSRLLRENSKLASNSAEQRIHGYDEFVDSLLAENRKASGRKVVSVGALLAGAALAAGGGTSHIELLKPYADEYPDCLPWFGLLAGLAGPRAWDSDWLRVVKGVERQIRGSHVLTDPLQGDLCWIEFDWLRQISKSSSVFSDLPKNHNRLLSIEVFPGATYQARLITAEARASVKSDPQSEPARASTNVVSSAQSSIGPDSNLLMQLTTISTELQTLVNRIHESRSGVLDGEQGELFEEKLDKTPKATKRPTNRTRKGTTKT